MIVELALRGGYVLREGGVLEQADVLIDEGKILKIGDGRGYTADEELDVSTCLVTPAFVNTHTHLPMTLFRGYADDRELDSWLREYIWPIEAKLSGRDVRAGALLGAYEMIRAGTSAFADMYFFMEKVAEVVRMSGLKAALSYGMIELDDEDRGKHELKKNRKFVKEFNGYADGRITTMYGPHAPNTCSLEFLQKVREYAEHDGVGIHIHLLETRGEKQRFEEKYGRSIIEVLDEVGFLRDDVLAAHCVWVSKRDIEILKARGVNVSHNPISNMKLASGMARVNEMLEGGVKVSLGTDGCASNNNLDMFGTMKVAAMLQKVRLSSPTVTPATEVFKMATLRGAQALGISSGILEAGMDADIMCIDLTSERMQPLHNAISNLVYSTTPADVVSTIVNGRVLMHKREVLTLDMSTISEEVMRSRETLFSSVDSDMI
ncbi:MAG: amidohydrolase family protein [Methermicoccaceae archaeon]